MWTVTPPDGQGQVNAAFAVHPPDTKTARRSAFVGKKWDHSRMVDDAGTSQARALLRELYGHVDDISRKLEAADGRTLSAQRRGVRHRDPMALTLRHELYEVHRLIDGLHRRFPETTVARRPAARQGVKIS